MYALCLTLALHLLIKKSLVFGEPNGFNLLYDAHVHFSLDLGTAMFNCQDQYLGSEVSSFCRSFVLLNSFSPGSQYHIILKDSLNNHPETPCLLLKTHP